jgi:hypothetical protein
MGNARMGKGQARTPQPYQPVGMHGYSPQPGMQGLGQLGMTNPGAVSGLGQKLGVSVGLGAPNQMQGLGSVVGQNPGMAQNLGQLGQQISGQFGVTPRPPMPADMGMNMRPPVQGGMLAHEGPGFMPPTPPQAGNDPRIARLVQALAGRRF